MDSAGIGQSPEGSEQASPPQQGGGGQQQLSPEQQQAQQIAAKERARADDARFASNLAYSRPPDQAQQRDPGQTVTASQRQADSSLVAPRAAGEQQESPEGYKRPVEANIDSAVGQPYLVYEGSVLDTVLMNRVDGDAAGAVKVLVSNPLYSHDHRAQDELKKLEAEYAPLEAQYNKDCLGGTPDHIAANRSLCENERKKTADLDQRIAVLRQQAMQQ